ncbi:hypothetical protein [Streptomyces sp. NPDC007088]|uniref:hypothetical protein n=1 Tax=Streptomyces sp. NPDC007088 TaxID=3364773 RepID=UPI0036B0D279
MEAGPRDTGHGEREQLVQDGPEDSDGTVPDGAGVEDLAALQAGHEAPEVEVELRPQRRMRLWQIAPIVLLAAVGSLMFAFPLAFEIGDGGAVVAMLGLLLSSSAAGGAVMAARRVGYHWPGLSTTGAERGPRWRVLAVYALIVLGAVVLAVWRVARLR